MRDVLLLAMIAHFQKTDKELAVGGAVVAESQQNLFKGSQNFVMSQTSDCAQTSSSSVGVSQ
ncbi:unnamed protein product, partial [Gongylonema pulchrum]|uniref:Orphan protein n=1 Tax=Gongylonema pulchrum TaxID=637853 RepID=A0A183DLE1_9BILA